MMSSKARRLEWRVVITIIAIGIAPGLLPILYLLLARPDLAPANVVAQCMVMACAILVVRHLILSAPKRVLVRYWVRGYLSLMLFVSVALAGILLSMVLVAASQPLIAMSVAFLATSWLCMMVLTGYNLNRYSPAD